MLASSGKNAACSACSQGLPRYPTRARYDTRCKAASSLLLASDHDSKGCVFRCGAFVFAVGFVRPVRCCRSSTADARDPNCMARFGVWASASGMLSGGIVAARRRMRLSPTPSGRLRSQILSIARHEDASSAGLLRRPRTRRTHSMSASSRKGWRSSQP
jgi:hypothetical protein